MTTFSKSVGPVLSKALLAGLVVTAMLPMPLQARESRAGDRQTGQSVGSTIPRIERDRPIAAPAHHAFAPAPSDQPDGVCDHGDDPMIC
ncbi:hypothetical protein QWJ07_19855 [Frankia sp. RB7]|nr:hypothetical protein [Frankia sp. RB7]